MPRNRSEQEPAIPGASAALMAVLIQDDLHQTPADDFAYRALSKADQSFYTNLPDAELKSWTILHRKWRQKCQEIKAKK